MYKMILHFWKNVYITSTIRTLKWFWNLSMKLIIFFVFVVILVVRGVVISDIMSRNPIYDNRTTLPTNVLSILISRSLLHCASYCTRNDECKSTMYNMNTHSCQLMSVHMDAVSDTGPQTYLGWLYYERKCGRYIFIKILVVFLSE